jgi:hypothetical protein
MKRKHLLSSFSIPIINSYQGTKVSDIHLCLIDVISLVSIYVTEKKTHVRMFMFERVFLYA